MKRKGGGKTKVHIHFAVRVTPVIPSFRNDDVVHVSVSIDHARKGTPSPSKVQCPRPRDLTVHK